MDQINLYRLYELGGDLRSFLDLFPPTGEMLAGEMTFPLLNARSALNVLLGPSSPVSLVLSQEAGKAALQSLDLIYNRYLVEANGTMKWPDASTTIPSYFVQSAQAHLRTFETVFRAETAMLATYSVRTIGTYDTRKLVDSADATFPEHVRDIVGSTALREYRDAGRCFAFGLSTAAGYHVCRAVEAVLRVYYIEFTGKSDPVRKMWGTLIKDLEALSSPNKPSEKTLDHIRHIKDFERNPISHAGVVLDENDADILLAGAKVAILAMARDIGAERARKSQPPALSDDHIIESAVGALAALPRPLKAIPT